TKNRPRSAAPMPSNRSTLQRYPKEATRDLSFHEPSPRAAERDPHCEPFHNGPDDHIMMQPEHPKDPPRTGAAASAARATGAPRDLPAAAHRALAEAAARRSAREQRTDRLAQKAGGTGGRPALASNTMVSRPIFETA